MITGRREERAETRWVHQKGRGAWAAEQGAGVAQRGRGTSERWTVFDGAAPPRCADLAGCVAVEGAVRKRCSGRLSLFPVCEHTQYTMQQGE